MGKEAGGGGGGGWRVLDRFSKACMTFQYVQDQL